MPERRRGRFFIQRILASSVLWLAGCVPKTGGPVAAVPQSPHGPVAPSQPYPCGRLLENNAVENEKLLTRAYSAWRRLYVTGVGARGNLRIRRPEDTDDSVSEGIAYGMLIAAYHGDQAIFDALHAYARAHFDGNGLMHWKVNSEGRVAGSGAASDADVDMAIALIVAGKLWGAPYGEQAKQMIDAIYATEIEPGTLVMKPGDGWGGSLVTNPSYFDPAYFKIFAEYTNSPKWLQVADKAYRVLELVGSHNRGTGLMPDWMTAGAGPAKGQSYDYKWDATRVPLRIARDAAWFCDPRAIRLLAPINEFFRAQGPLTIGDGYKITGEKFSSVHAAAFVGPVAAASLFSTDEGFRKTLFTDLVKRWGGGYYSNHLRHLSLLFVTGSFPNPLTMTPATVIRRVPNPTETLPAAPVQPEGETRNPVGEPSTPAEVPPTANLGTDEPNMPITPAE